MVSDNVARSAQQGARTAQESFNRFVEGGPGTGGSSRSYSYSQVPIDESKRDFWDDFSSIAEQRKAESSAIGTAAMGKGGSSSSSSGGAAGNTAGVKSKDEWDDW